MTNVCDLEGARQMGTHHERILSDCLLPEERLSLQNEGGFAARVWFIQPIVLHINVHGKGEQCQRPHFVGSDHRYAV
jgi:hypothetical protein